ncbi:RNA polymerase sigma factor [Myxococcota bacterium]
MRLGDVGDLYRRLGPTIYRRCLRLLGDSEMARDATQEVFLRTIRKAGELREDRAYLPWLYRVATNHCLDLLRKTTPMALEDLPEMTTAGDERAIANRQLVVSLLQRMDERSQQIAIYAFVDQMTQEEIADVMGLSRRTVGKKLKKVLEQARGPGQEALA